MWGRGGGAKGFGVVLTQVLEVLAFLKVGGGAGATRFHPIKGAAESVTTLKGCKVSDPLLSHILFHHQHHQRAEQIEVPGRKRVFTARNLKC